MTMSHLGGGRSHSDMNMSLDDVPLRESKGDRHSPYGGGPASGDDSNRDRRIFVSHIPFRYNWRDLKDEIRKMGFEVVYCELFLDDGGKSKGCGVVELATETQAKRAMEQLDGYLWDEMRLSAHEDRSNNYVRGLKSRVRHTGEGGGPMRSRSPVRGGSSRGQRSYRDDPPSSSQLDALGQLQQLNQLASLLTTGASGQAREPDINDPRAGNIVFVANIDYSITWQRLKDLLSEAGRVRHVHLRTDRDGQSKGIATAEFDSHREAMKCIDIFNGHMVNGRALRLHLYRENDRDALRGMSTQSLPNPPPNLTDLLSATSAGSSGNNPMQILNALSSFAVLQQLTQSGSNAGVLDALKSNSRQYGSSSSGSHRDSHRSGSSRDDYRSRPDRPRHDDRSRMPPRDYRHDSSERGSSREHGHSGSGGFHHQSSRSGPSGHSNYPRVFVRHLDWGMDWQDVQDLFKEAGEVVEVDVLREPDGRSKGRATVTYRNVDDCYRAIDLLNGTSVRGRTIEVKVDHFS